MISEKYLSDGRIALANIQMRELQRIRGGHRALEESINDVMDDILSDFDSDRGIGSNGYDVASKYIDYFWEDAEYIGREETGILNLYMLAFELATKQLAD